MLDPRFIRENSDLVKANIVKRRLSGPQFDVDAFLEIDTRRRSVIGELEGIRALRNELSSISQKPSEEVIAKVKDTKEQIKMLEEELSGLDSKWEWHMSWFPNMLDPTVPDGNDDTDNVELRAWVPGVGYLPDSVLGKKDASKIGMPQPSFEGKDHLTLGESLGIIDTKQSALVSGSRFKYLRAEGALLLKACFSLLSQKLLSDGFTPMVVPLMVKKPALFGSSHIPGDEDQIYRVSKEFIENEEELYLVGSSEPALFAYYMNKTLNQSDLPQKVYAETSCFRTEVGSWGKDVRGIKRVHQFEKLEMDLICEPEDSDRLLDHLVSINEWFLQTLKIPYHIIRMCSGDIGYFAARKKYDIEGWLPHEKTFIELGSATSAGDYQARRYNTKYKTKEGKVLFAHNVNDTGCADRILIAILENYQQADGSVVVPEALKPYMQGIEVIKKSET